MRYIIFLLLLFTVPGTIFAQSPFETGYEPIVYKGQIPREVLKNAKDKAEESISSANVSLSKKDKSELYTTINFQVSEVLLSGVVYYNDDLTTYVNKIVDRLLKDSPDKRNALHVYVAKFTDMNAHCWGDGSIFVNIGILSKLENEGELAFVLSHEISHYFLKHSALQFKKDKEINERALNKGKEMEALFKKLRFSRANEFEADMKGFDLMAAAGYDMNEAVKGLLALKKAETEKYTDTLDFKQLFNTDFFTLSPKILMTEKDFRPGGKKKSHEKRKKRSQDTEDEEESTHPSIDKRVEAIREAIKQKTGVSTEPVTGEFARISSMCDFECMISSFNNANYPKSLYLALELQKRYPHNDYLKTAIAANLYWLSLYKAGGNTPNILESFKSAKDRSLASTLFLLDKITDKDMLTLSWSYIKKQYEADKSNEELCILMAEITEQKDGLEKAGKYYQEYADKFPQGKHARYAIHRTKL